MVVRHGARYPQQKSFEAQRQLLNISRLIDTTRKAKLCTQDLEVSLLLLFALVNLN